MDSNWPSAESPIQAITIEDLLTLDSQDSLYELIGAGDQIKGAYSAELSSGVVDEVHYVGIGSNVSTDTVTQFAENLADSVTRKASLIIDLRGVNDTKILQALFSNTHFAVFLSKFFGSCALSDKSDPKFFQQVAYWAQMCGRMAGGKVSINTINFQDIEAHVDHLTKK